MAVGVAAVGVLDEAGDEGALGERRELVEGLAEVSLGGLADAVDGEGAALADVDLVGVHLKDLLLVEARLELEGDHDLAKLARVVSFSGERKKPRASCMVRVEPPHSFWWRGEVLDGALGDANVVDAAVLEEAAIFNGGDGLDHARGISLKVTRRRLVRFLSSESAVMSCWLKLVGARAAPFSAVMAVTSPPWVTVMVAPSVVWKDCGPGLMEMESPRELIGAKLGSFSPAL